MKKIRKIRILDLWLALGLGIVGAAGGGTGGLFTYACFDIMLVNIGPVA